eukprot:10713537-Ditylum_brightwellii.AAC.1
MATARIHDHNNRAVLQDEVVEVEDKINSNGKSDSNNESNEESNEESVKESVNQGCEGLVHKVDLEGECTKPSVPKLHHDAKNRVQWWWMEN